MFHSKLFPVVSAWICITIGGTSQILRKAKVNIFFYIEVLSEASSTVMHTELGNEKYITKNICGLGVCVCVVVFVVVG